MHKPGKHTESDNLVGYLEGQLDSIRAAAYGLNEAQARETPCRSSLSIGGLIKHATYVMQGRERNRANPGAMPDEAGFARFIGSFALADRRNARRRAVGVRRGTDGLSRGRPLGRPG